MAGGAGATVADCTGDAVVGGADALAVVASAVAEALAELLELFDEQPTARRPAPMMQVAATAGVRPRTKCRRRS